MDAVASLSRQIHQDEDTADDAQSQLAHDLAVFLNNPSLRQALEDGSLDLPRYSEQVAAELEELEKSCIEAYRSKAGVIDELDTELKECQSVLAGLQELLLGFQADLGGLSGEIRQLQEKSKTLDVQLKNRRQAEAGLRHCLEHLVLSPNLVQVLTHADVNPQFLDAVRELNTIHANVSQKEPQAWSSDLPPSETAVGPQVLLTTENLRKIAVRRSREYFLQQMAHLRRPQTNIRMIQVHGLLQYADLYEFIEQASPPIGQELYNIYMESMSKTLVTLFRTYQTQLLQLDLSKQAVSRNDVLAMDDALLRDSLTTKAKKRVDVFCLGRRAIDCLGDDEDSSVQEPHQPILAHVALAEKKKYPYERLFKSILGHLVDAVTNEHVFGRQFFKRDTFAPLFHGTLGQILEQLENYLFGCYDALSLLLMIKVTHSYRRLARSRRIHSLDSFFDQITNLLWPRLKSLMEAHIKSLQNATATKLGGVDLHAHYVSRRFAEFCCSLLLILQNKTTLIATGSSPQKSSSSDRDGSDKQPSSLTASDLLLGDMSLMVDEFVNLIERLSDDHTIQKSKIVFWINNLDNVIAIFQERRVAGAELNRFLELLIQQRELFVEEELLGGFSKMIAFVQQTESHMSTIPKDSVDFGVNPQVVEALVLDFASNWKAHIEQVNRNVLSYFSNFRNGMEILKQVLTQLLLYYTRFQDIIRKVWRGKPPSFAREIVSTNIILAEIKKYAMAI